MKRKSALKSSKSFYPTVRALSEFLFLCSNFLVEIWDHYLCTGFALVSLLWQHLLKFEPKCLFIWKCIEKMLSITDRFSVNHCGPFALQRAWEPLWQETKRWQETQRGRLCLSRKTSDCAIKIQVVLSSQPSYEISFTDKTRPYFTTPFSFSVTLCRELLTISDSCDVSISTDAFLLPVAGSASSWLSWLSSCPGESQGLLWLHAPAAECWCVCCKPRAHSSGARLYCLVHRHLPKVQVAFWLILGFFIMSLNQYLILQKKI